MGRQTLKNHRTRAAEAQGWKCYWCGCKMHTHEHRDYVVQAEFLCTADHVVPRAKGGTNRRDNIVAACRGCNEVRSNAEELDRLAERIEKLKWLATRS